MKTKSNKQYKTISYQIDKFFMKLWLLAVPCIFVLIIIVTSLMFPIKDLLLSNLDILLASILITMKVFLLVIISAVCLFIASWLGMRLKINYDSILLPCEFKELVSLMNKLGMVYVGRVEEIHSFNSRLDLISRDLQIQAINIDNNYELYAPKEMIKAIYEDCITHNLTKLDKVIYRTDRSYDKK